MPLLRTILILLAVFIFARIIPPGATILGLGLAAITIASIVDFYLEITTSRGLLSHIFNH